MGTTEDVFQSVGGRPHAIEQLNNFVSDGAIALAVDLNMRAEMPSGPLALDTSRDFSSSQTSSTVHRKSGGQSEVPVGVEVEIGGQDELKQLQKNSLNALALAFLEIKSGRGRPAYARARAHRSRLLASLRSVIMYVPGIPSESFIHYSSRYN